MPDPKDGYAYIEGVSEQECYERWYGNDWVADDEDPETGLCESNYDFDGWAEEHQGEE